MKEYECIVLATNEIFSHMIISTICLENYYNDSIENAFNNIFTMFNKLRIDYGENVKNIYDIEEMQIHSARFKTKCRVKREEILKSFINEMYVIDNTIDYEEKVQEYYNRIDTEDVETLEMQLMLYPYLMSLVRKKEEKLEG